MLHRRRAPCIRATEDAVAALSDPARTLTASDVVNLHKVVDPHLPSGLRAEQNWVGGPGGAHWRGFQRPLAHA
jgi:hypothetical protein